MVEIELNWKSGCIPITLVSPKKKKCTNSTTLLKNIYMYLPSPPYEQDTTQSQF